MSFVVAMLCGCSTFPAADPPSAERALAFLAREVPRWSAENKCYSCHNNGDAARALFAAARLQYSLPAKVLDDTTRWLTRPQNWHKNGGDVEYKDEALARIQFAAALVEAMDAGLVKEQGPLLTAAELVAKDQDPAGSWSGKSQGDVGSPVNYGIPLATLQARRVLARAGADKYQQAVARADAWLLAAPVERVLDAAAVLAALSDMDRKPVAAKAKECLQTIRKGESKEGGWGPFVNSAPEVFDTAIVLLALVRLPADRQEKELIERGGAFLRAAQKKDGSWPETTRPTGGASYAQRLSTTGWATLALLATRQ